MKTRKELTEYLAKLSKEESELTDKMNSTYNAREIDEFQKKIDNLTIQITLLMWILGT